MSEFVSETMPKADATAKGVYLACADFVGETMPKAKARAKDLEAQLDRLRSTKCLLDNGGRLVYPHLASLNLLHDRRPMVKVLQELKKRPSKQ